MRKKLVSLITIAVFMVFSISCLRVYTTKKDRTTKSVLWKGKKVQILAVMKTSGEYIEFSKNSPGKAFNLNIIGTLKKEIEIDNTDIQEIKRDLRGTIIKVIIKPGKVYPFKGAMIDTVRFQEIGDRIFVTYNEPISIPFAEVELAWVKRVDPTLSFFATLGLTAAILFAAGAIIVLIKESCPFIYSFNGEKYVFDAEPYGGATCQGLKRTEWSGLEHLSEVDGKYKIMITNEVDETQYTDEIKLVVVDHPEGVKVAPDESGKIHTISQPIIPVNAVDGKGRDLMKYISENDWIFWQSRTEGRDPDKKEDLKDELIFEFPKPDGATKAKLLFNGCNTLWGSQMVKRFLDLYGNEVYKYYDDVNNFGPSYYYLMNWNSREELFRLHIQVETDNGWKSKGTIVGGGPFVSEDKIYTFDISDVPGNNLKIKLTPPVAFWMINYLAVDYSMDFPIQVTEIEATEAFDHKGQDVREILAEKDNNYLIMPNIGDYAELIFESPAHNSDMERSVILKASGYYDIHLEAKGEPHTDILEKMFFEPGFTIQYAFKEYLKWKKEAMQRIGFR